MFTMHISQNEFCAIPMLCILVGSANSLRGYYLKCTWQEKHHCRATRIEGALLSSVWPFCGQHEKQATNDRSQAAIKVAAVVECNPESCQKLPPFADILI